MHCKAHCSQYWLLRFFKKREPSAAPLEGLGLAGEIFVLLVMKLLELPRAEKAFAAMEQDKHVIVMLSPANATAGRVLATASKSIEGLFEKHKPMKSMFGITHDVVLSGYQHQFEV